MAIRKLFQPLTIKGMTAKNRIVVSPMCQYKSVEGSPVDWHLVNLGRYAIGGAGIIFYEETAVLEDGRKTLHCAGLYRDDQVIEYKRITDFLKSLGSLPAMQLGHSGARGSERGPQDGRAALSRTGGDAWQSMSASAVPIRPDTPAPREMTVSDIRDVIDGFAQATRRSLEAGFEILEVHGAHGYLIQQFLSPVMNRRTDRYGGDIKNRMRFALEVTEAVRAVWPDEKPLFYRASCVDGKGGIWDMDDTAILAKELEKIGVDVFDCSSGGILGDSDLPIVKRVPGYHVPFARRINSETNMLTMAAGMINTAEQAEDHLEKGDVDLICMARQMMMNADWPMHAARDLGEPDYLDILPGDFAFRLKSLEDQKRMTINQIA